MNSRLPQAFRRLALLAIVAVPAAFCAEGVTTVETVGDFVTQMPHEDTEPFVQYCKAALTEIEPTLNLEYEQYSSRLEEASALFRQKMAKHAYLRQPVPPDIAMDQRQQNARRLADAMAEDPKVYCSALQEKMAARTVDFLTKRLEGIFVRLETLNNLNKQLKRYGVKPAP